MKIITFYICILSMFLLQFSVKVCQKIFFQYLTFFFAEQLLTRDNRNTKEQLLNVSGYNKLMQCNVSNHSLNCLQKSLYCWWIGVQGIALISLELGNRSKGSTLCQNYRQTWKFLVEIKLNVKLTKLNMFLKTKLVYNLVQFKQNQTVIGNTLKCTSLTLFQKVTKHNL